MGLTSAAQDSDVMAEINITPFTDVLLVLLIIFMILTSLLKPPAVPEALNRLKVTESPILVIIRHENAKDIIQVGSEDIPEEKIYESFKNYHDIFNQQNDIIIKAAPAVKYGTVLRVMDAALDYLNGGFLTCSRTWAR